MNPKVKNVLTGGFCVVFIIAFFAVVNYQLSRPIAQISYETGKPVSVELNNGKILHPGDVGFKEALADADHEWVR
jgi:hypothetical protein